MTSRRNDGMKNRTKRASLLFALILLTVSVLPFASALAEQKGVVKGGWLILRSAPSFNGAILSSYPTGTQVTITGQKGSWYAVTAPDGLTGYMLGDYLQVSGGSGGVPSETTAYVTSRNGKGVNLRSGPGKNYASIGFYSVGTPAMMVSPGGAWSYIRVGNRYGYMMTQFLTETPPVQPVIGGSHVISANGKNVNLRLRPAKNSKVIKSFKVGTPLTIIVRGADWYFVEINGYYGYMMRQFIYDGGTPATPTEMIL